MNEQLVELWNKMRRRLDQIVIAVLVLLLGVMVFFWWVEQQVPPPTKPPRPVATVTTATPENWPLFVKTFDHPTDVSKVPGVGNLLGVNMFERKSVNELTRRMEVLRKKIEAGQTALSGGDLGAAEKAAREVLALMPTNFRARDLLRQVEDKKKEAEAAKATPEPTPSV